MRIQGIALEDHVDRAFVGGNVRHVLPVRSEREDGTILDYACLCTRCLEGEKVLATRVRVGMGEAYVEYTRKS